MNPAQLAEGRGSVDTLVQLIMKDETLPLPLRISDALRVIDHEVAAEFGVGLGVAGSVLVEEDISGLFFVPKEAWYTRLFRWMQAD